VLSVYFDFFQLPMTVIYAFHLLLQSQKGVTMSDFYETLTEVKTDIIHASISLDNEKKEQNQKDDANRMLRARRAIEQHLEEKRLHHNISNGWDD
jgi:hypothetical protein